MRKRCDIILVSIVVPSIVASLYGVANATADQKPLLVAQAASTDEKKPHNSPGSAGTHSEGGPQSGSPQQNRPEAPAAAVEQRPVTATFQPEQKPASRPTPPVAIPKPQTVAPQIREPAPAAHTQPPPPAAIQAEPHITVAPAAPAGNRPAVTVAPVQTQQPRPATQPLPATTTSLPNAPNAPQNHPAQPPAQAGPAVAPQSQQPRPNQPPPSLQPSGNASVPVQQPRPGSQPAQVVNQAPATSAVPAPGGPGVVLPPVPQKVQPGQQPRPNNGNGNTVAIAAGAAAGFVGGFLASQALSGINQVQSQRQFFDDGGARIYREPGRMIIQDPDNRYFIAHDENERFRDLGYDVRDERQGDQLVASYRSPDGSEVVTYTDDNGRLLRRMRRLPDGRELVLIDNGPPGPPPPVDSYIVDLPPPPLMIPQDRYVVAAARVDEGTIYDTFTAPPVAPLPGRYTLNQIRYSADLRARMRSVDLDTINFDTGSWTVAPDQAVRLEDTAAAINRVIQRNPREVFLVEGYTDAVGEPVDNLSLSDRRAQSVASLLTQQFRVPPENLTTQGYGAQYLKVQTQAAEPANRRVTVRRITPLMAGNSQP